MKLNAFTSSFLYLHYKRVTTNQHTWLTLEPHDSLLAGVNMLNPRVVDEATNWSNDNTTKQTCVSLVAFCADACGKLLTWQNKIRAGCQQSEHSVYSGLIKSLCLSLSDAAQRFITYNNSSSPRKDFWDGCWLVCWWGFYFFFFLTFFFHKQT